MNEKQIILDFLEWERASMEKIVYNSEHNSEEHMQSIVSQYLAQKETQEKDPEWFMETFWTENRA